MMMDRVLRALDALAVGGSSCALGLFWPIHKINHSVFKIFLA